MKKQVLEDINYRFKVPEIYSLKTAQSMTQGLFAVRSNDSSEDSDTTAKAGKFNTELFVKNEGLNAAIENVLSTADDYFIQDMILNPDFSIVALCEQIGNRNKVTLTINNGYCELITAGKVTGKVMIFNPTDTEEYSEYGKQKKEMVYQNGIVETIESTIPKYDNNIISEILWQLRGLQEFLNLDNMNVELSVKDSEIFILQARPYHRKDS